MFLLIFVNIYIVIPSRKEEKPLYQVVHRYCEAVFCGGPAFVAQR